MKNNKMRIKKINRICSVKGCKNTVSYAISRSSEMGGVIICADCLRAALDATTNIDAAKPITKSAKNTSALFFHPESNINPVPASEKREKPSSKSAQKDNKPATGGNK